MKIVFFTNEFPPHIYGGAGVHVDYLTRELAALGVDVDVRCFGDQQLMQHNLNAIGYRPDEHISYSDKRFVKAVGALSCNLKMVSNLKDVDLVHCHTWYAHFAGLLAKQLYQIPTVLTTHSFEPSRPWKVEQLGNAYHLSSWVERMAMEQSDGIITVSKGMKKDALKYFNIDPKKIEVIYNGIDLDEYKPTQEVDALQKYKVDTKIPYVLFVGRITRQKGIIHLVNAIQHIDKNLQVVLCAGAPDTPEIAAEMKAAVQVAQKTHPKVIWIEEMVAKKDVIQLYSHATVFCCPSVYEPFGIINLEAMACETPVVASAVGGIPEIIVPGETGFLVSFEPVSDTNTEPKNPAQFSKDLAEGINKLALDTTLNQQFAKAGRKRVEEVFGWKAIAQKTLEYYEKLAHRS